MKNLTFEETQEVAGGMVFFVYFAAGYLGAFSLSAGFAYGAVDAMSENR
ncbi:hypothetical protein [Ferrimonas balearica]|nr:hypothetical protein [Ferrimonas balearica]